MAHWQRGEPSGHGSYAANFSTTVKKTCDTCKAEANVKFMHHIDPQKCGRHLCPNCWQHYLNKEGTVRRSTTQTAHTFRMDSEHRQVIHNQIAEAQRGRTCQMSFSLKFILAYTLSDVSNDVQAVGRATPAASGHARAGEPSEPRFPSTSGYVVNSSMGPAVHLPGYRIQQDPPLTMHLQQGRTVRPVGYTAAHAMYPVVRNERIQEAYSTYNAEVVIVDVRLVVKLPGRVKESLVHVRVFTCRGQCPGHHDHLNNKINSRIVPKLWITYLFILGPLS
jgi:hypothetical protein